MSYQKQKLLTICDQRGSSPIFLGVRVSHFFCFELCFCALLVLLLCFVCPMLPVSFHCPFLIAPFFSIVYLTLQLGIVALTDVSDVRHYHVNDWWISLTQISAWHMTMSTPIDMKYIVIIISLHQIIKRRFRQSLI